MLRRVFRDARNVGVSVLIATILLALRSVLVLSVVGPTVIGVWKSVVFLVFLSGFARLGISQAVGLRVPLLRAQGRYQDSERLSAAAASALGLTGLALALAVFTSSFFVMDTQYRLALRLASVVILVTQFQEFLRELANAHHQSAARSREALVDAVTNFVATLVLAHFFGLAGLGVAAILTALLPVIYLSRRLRFRPVPAIDREAIRDLIRVGLPYSLMEQCFHLTKYLGVPIVALLLGATAAGYYALSTLLLEFASNVIQFGISRVVGPHLMSEFGSQGSHTKVAAYYEVPARLISYVLPPLLLLVTFTLPLIVEMSIPRFSEGVAAAQVAIWGVFFLGVNVSLDSFLNAAGSVVAGVRLSLLLIPVGVGIHLVAVWAGLGLVGLSAACAFTLGLQLTAKIMLARRECGYGKAETFAFLATLYLPLLAAQVIFVIVRQAGFSTIMAAPLAASLEGTLCMLLYAPLFAAYEARFSLVRAVHQAM